MIPKGTIVIIGGAEDRGEEESRTEQKNAVSERFEILKELIGSRSGRKRIEIITTATNDEDGIKEMYRSAFKKLNFGEVGFLDISDKEQAREMDCCERITKAHAV